MKYSTANSIVHLTEGVACRLWFQRTSLLCKYSPQLCSSLDSNMNIVTVHTVVKSPAHELWLLP